MKRRLIFVLTLTLLLVVPGCGRRMYLENRQIILMTGADLNNDQRLTVYTSTPVFSVEAKQKYNISETSADTLRQARSKLDAMSTGPLASGKIQTVLIGKKLLQRPDMLHYMDVFMRDPKSEINANILAVDGPVKDIMYANMKDKGRPGVVLKEQTEAAFSSRTAVKTIMQEFHQQLLDPRRTPAMTEVKLSGNEIVVTGTALLSKEGAYATSLNNEESALLLLLQQRKGQPFPFTFHIPPKKIKAAEHLAFLSLEIGDTQYDIKVRHENSRFAFDIRMKIKVNLTERLFEYDLEKDKKPLEQALQQEMTKKFEALIAKIQKHRIDPIGLGVYAKAFQFAQWKKVENDWGKALAEAKIRVMPDVVIQSSGVAM
ncbi:Ger(x)C family spore germination protein [Paenibacillus ehimensis]|uniref:Ger(x)C family spore germination protein n=1 Tax=Paenibacillus ehimensis TaxID=79264 RepID=UPI000470E856|nr:Ger(x)C family spore germination protein [Paenibacillus ehimensis]